MRFGNLVAKADGTIGPEESHQLKGLIAEINRHLRPVSIEGESGTSAVMPPAEDIRRALGTVPDRRKYDQRRRRQNPRPAATCQQTDEQRLQAALQIAG